MKIGDYEVKTLNVGAFRLDGGAMFGNVPKVLWEKQEPADELNRIQMVTRIILARSSDRIVLVDCGLGNKWSDKKAEMFAIDFNQYSLERALSAENLKPSDITDLVLTHLHFDHAGGVSQKVNGQLEATFPQARIWVQKENLENAMQPNLRERASYLEENWSFVKDSPHLQLLDGPGELFPGFRATISHGHTQGLQSIWIEDGSQSLLYAADLIPMAAHVNLPWIMGYDICPATILEEKHKTLIAALNKNTQVVFEHDSRIEACQLKEEKGRIAPGEVSHL